MRVEFPYPEISAVDIPDGNLTSVYEPGGVRSANEPGLVTFKAVSNPVNSPALAELASGKRNAVILCDDYTRQTPLRIIIPLLIPHLLDAGIPPWDVTILVALGTHRPMTDKEKLERLGPEICHVFKVVEHNWKDEANMVSIDKIDAGPDIKINRLAAEADLLIGVGQIVPHRIAGFSGGSKIIVPGICGSEVSAYTHWLGGTLPGDQVLGVRDNSVRQIMDRAAAKAGLRFIVNAICDPDGNVVDIIAGDPVEAHRKGAEISRRVFGVDIPEATDIVIVDSFPKDIELWQAAKALYAAELMVKQDGVVILVTPCPEGVSRTHKMILERGYKPEAETLEEVVGGKLTDLMTASHCLRVGRLIKDRATGILVSPGISKKDTEHLGFIYAETPQRALEIALEMKGRNASIAVLKKGGEALPEVGRGNQ